MVTNLMVFSSNLFEFPTMTHMQNFMTFVRKVPNNVDRYSPSRTRSKFGTIGCSIKYTSKITQIYIKDMRYEYFLLWVNVLTYLGPTKCMVDMVAVLAVFPAQVT